MLRDEQLRVFWISRIDYEKNTGVKSHYHDDLYQLLFIIDGDGYIKINGEIYNLLPKHAYLFPKQHEHSFHFEKISSTIDVKFDIINRKLEDLLKDNSPSMPYFIGESPKLQELFKLSVMNLKEPNPILLYRIDVVFKDFLLSIAQENMPSQNSINRSIYTKMNEYHPNFPIMDYLSENLQSKITLEDIAQRFNFHPHYIIELFRKIYDTTPMNFLQDIRIEKSKEYLEFSSFTITEIAELIGLSAPYFSRLFRKKEGISPTEYREQARTVVGKDILLEDEFLPSFEKQPKIE
ncbi:AraC family transcriptional regulator [Bacillus sp. HNG]|uniref:helix-turn-helix transcriptional regulator n=1 Tax=Bacillus sp. HNG TaxID=2293325 RepID=UPI000E2F71D0|nr:AraC family transcriptional regulator [Bacillus sp. HNG]RFB17430.1 AraC family transcriptional regulator [Bacillus sp. HNG]